MNAVFLLPLHVLAVVGRGIASRLGSDVSSTMGEAAVAEADLLGMVVHNLVERYSIGAGWQSAGSGSKSTDDGARFATGSNITELVDWVVVCAELYAQSGVLKSPQQSKQMFRSLLSSTFNGDEAAWHEHYAKTPHLQESGEPVGTHPTSKMFSNLASVTHVSHPTSPHGAQLSRRQHGRASTSKSDAGGALPTAAPMSTTVGRQRLVGGSGEETLLTPLEAEWKRFVTPLSMESRAQLQHLLYETTLGVDVLQSIVQQLYLVEQADVFLSPVPPTTVMEYDGVRSGPYCSVVLQPQSLYLVTKDVVESRRELPVPNTPAATAEPAQLATTSHSRRIVTLAELERSVWHIATNCVVFNAPDSFYPRTARSFALSCTRVIQQYCRQHLGL